MISPLGRNATASPPSPVHPDAQAYLPGWPKKVALATTSLLPTIGDGVAMQVAVGDVDAAHPGPEIVAASAAGPVYVFDAAGQSVYGSTAAGDIPLFWAGGNNLEDKNTFGANRNSNDLVGSFVGFGGPTLGDVAGDGYREIVAAAGPRGAGVAWGQYGCDAYHSGACVNTAWAALPIPTTTTTTTPGATSTTTATTTSTSSTRPATTQTTATADPAIGARGLAASPTAVVTAAGSLPITGGSIAGLLALAGVLVILGLATVVFARTHRSPPGASERHTGRRRQLSVPVPVPVRSRCRCRCRQVGVREGR